MKKIPLLGPALLVWASVGLGQDAPAPENALATESHLLQFERFLMMHAPEELRPTDFSISRCHELDSGRRPWGYQLSIQFVRADKPLLLDRDYVLSMVHNVETSPGSTWRLRELEMRSRTTGGGVKWQLQQLKFWRPAEGLEVFSSPPVLEPVHTGLSGLHDIFALAADRGIAHQLTAIHYIDLSRASFVRRGGVPAWQSAHKAELTVDFAVYGQRFRSGYVRIAKLFTDACARQEGPFVQWSEPRDEEILVDAGKTGASYSIELQMRARDSVVDADDSDAR